MSEKRFKRARRQEKKMMRKRYEELANYLKSLPFRYRYLFAGQILKGNTRGVGLFFFRIFKIVFLVLIGITVGIIFKEEIMHYFNIGLKNIDKILIKY